ncbi:MAG TPA: FAD-binding protein [Solirubrobacterales bacterium]|jgi:L-gulonolactone oxidase|nr:FAD-binding protein [Solirubrobacterales bacterium]
MSSGTGAHGGSGRAWRNWAGDQLCEPFEQLRPRSREELAEAIAAAAAAGRKVSVAGSGHSFTEVAMTGGTMVDVGALSGVVDADLSSGLVKVAGGTVLADLNDELHRLGLAMENLGDIDRQTIAGAISTGTHGTGAKLRNISSQVESIELVLADGSVRELDAAGDPDLLRAARVRDRRPRRDLVGGPSLRSRLHSASGRLSVPARGGLRRLPGAR